MRSLILAFSVLVELLSFGPAQAQIRDEALASFALNSPDTLTLQTVATFFSVEGRPAREGNTYEVIVPESQISFLQFLAPTAKLIDADTAATAQSRLHKFTHNISLMAENYHTFDTVQKWMQDLAATHPKIVQILPYGKSAAGRPLTALRLNVDNKSIKPVLMITAATHGDELITTEVLIRLIEELVSGYGSNARLTKIVDSHDIYFVPVLNPDGFVATRRFDGDADPNRSYPYPGHESAVPTASIAGIIHLFEMIHPVGSIDFHAFGELVMYPWGYSHTKVSEPFYSKFETLTAAMSATNNYTHGPIADVIYVAPGSSADYYFWKSNSISLGIEMGQEKIPDPSEIPAYVRSQEESSWKFIESF